jgi:hypothetical protein
MIIKNVIKCNFLPLQLQYKRYSESCDTIRLKIWFFQFRLIVFQLRESLTGLTSFLSELGQVAGEAAKQLQQLKTV